MKKLMITLCALIALTGTNVSARKTVTPIKSNTIVDLIEVTNENGDIIGSYAPSGKAQGYTHGTFTHHFLRIAPYPVIQGSANLGTPVWLAVPGATDNLVGYIDNPKHKKTTQKIAGGPSKKIMLFRYEIPMNDARIQSLAQENPTAAFTTCLYNYTDTKTPLYVSDSKGTSEKILQDSLNMSGVHIIYIYKDSSYSGRCLKVFCKEARVQHLSQGELVIVDCDENKNPISEYIVKGLWGLEPNYARLETPLLCVYNDISSISGLKIRPASTSNGYFQIR